MRTMATATALFWVLLGSPALGLQLVDREVHPRLLIFQAVRSTDDVREMLKSNIDHLKAAGLSFDLVLAHYDGKHEDFSHAIGENWYNLNVKYSQNEPGYKMHLLNRFVNTSNVNLMDYDWVWPIDEDMDLSRTDPERMLMHALDSSAMIVGASYQQTAPPALPANAPENKAEDGGVRRLETSRGEGEHFYPVNKPHPECRFRYTPMVSFEMPLIKSEVMQLVSKCDHCMQPGDNDTDFGLERMLCSFVAEKFQRATTKSCAILDNEMVVHRNLQSAHPTRNVRASFTPHEYFANAFSSAYYVKHHSTEHNITYVDRNMAMVESWPGYDCVKA